MIGQKQATDLHRLFYRVTGGRLLHRWGKGEIVILVTTGRKSGKRREHPLLGIRDGDGIFLVASNGGAPTHPAWFLNLEADPNVEVIDGRNTKPMRADVLSPAQKQAVWPRIVDANSGYGDYQQKTERDIPVVRLHPR